MVRNYIRKTKQGSVPADVIRRAIDCVNVSGRSIRAVAEQYDLSHVSLGRYVRRAQCSGAVNVSFQLGRFRQVFTDEQENILADYLKTAASIYFGLSPKEVRVLAYDCTLVHSIPIPDSWCRDQQAGEDWFANFMKRHPALSIRQPEATSLGRATSFNKNNVQLFFDKLAEVVDRDNIGPADTWNCDETGVTTVQKPRNIVAPKGVKQIGQLTSAERGSHVTVCAAVNAIGNSIPPMFIFPRVKYHDHFIRDGPAGCIGASQPSGWMTATSFTKFLTHFISYAKPTTSHKVLLLLDNHESHISIEALDLAKANGIVMLSFPPHCSHKLQPLDRSVFGPLKKFVNSAQDSWMRRNPGRTMTIYDIPSVLRDSWPLAATPSNIASGFRVAGVYPYNVDVFGEQEFAPCSVTDRPNPNLDSNSQPDPTTNVQYTIKDIMSNLGREIVPVAGDGHCLLHAFRGTLMYEGIANLSHDELCTSLMEEVTENIDYYDDFSTENQTVLLDLERYIKDQVYNIDTVDIVLNALCNYAGVSAIVYRYGNDDDTNVQIHAIAPGRPGVLFRGDVHLVLKGDGVAAHYNATRKINTEDVDQHIGQGSSQDPATPVFTARPLFSPESVRPHPKAGPRTSNKGKPKRKSSILTDTPEKKLIEEEFAKKQNKQTKSAKKPTAKSKVKPKKIKSSKSVKSAKQRKESTSDEEECFCLFCVEPFSNSKPREGWIQCYMCKGWAHEECAGIAKNQLFVCHNCESDDDVFL